MTIKTYKTPTDFKTALGERLKQTTSAGGNIDRRRQLMVFDRFLARVIDELGDAVVLKGGLALEIRLERARTTRDVDIRVSEDSSQMLSRLQQAGRLDLGDFMSFEVRPHFHRREQDQLSGEGPAGYRPHCATWPNLGVALVPGVRADL